MIVDPEGQVLNGVTVIARGTTVERRAVTNDAGQFTLEVPNENVSLSVQGQYIKPYQRDLPLATPVEPLKIEIEYLIPPIHHSIVITASALGASSRDPQRRDLQEIAVLTG